MKLLFVQPVLSYRGGERVIATLTNKLSEKHSIAILFFKRDTKIKENYFSENVRQLYPARLLNKVMQNNLVYILISPFVGVYYLLKFGRLGDTFITDSFPCLYAAVIVSKLYRKKCIWIVHSFEVKAYPQSSYASKAYFKVIHSLNLLFSYFLTSAITNSPKVTTNIKRSFPHLKVNEIIPPVNNPVLITEANPTTNYELGNRKIIVCVGELHPLKNQQLALDAFIILKKHIPNSSLVFIGRGSAEPYRNQIINAQLQENTDVIFTGELTQEQLYSWYQHSDIVLQTAFYPEGLGLTPFEGLLFHKLPVVVVGSGAALIIRQVGIGMVTKPLPTEIANVMQRYLDNPAEYTYTIEKGYQFVLNHMNTQSYVKEFSSIISTV